MPKLVDRQEKRQTILDAALRVFSQKGFTATKMADIANQAGIGKGTIYEYFSSKKEVFSELFRYLSGDFDKEFERQMAQTNDPVEQIKLIIQIYFVDFINRYGDFVKIVMDFWMAEARSEEKGTLPQIDMFAIYDHYTKLVADIITKGIRRKLFRPVNAEHYAAMLLGIFDGLYLQMFLKVNQFKPEEIAKSILDLFLASLTNPNRAGDTS